MVHSSIASTPIRIQAKPYQPTMRRSKSPPTPVAASLRLGPSCRMWVALVLSCMATRTSTTVFGKGGFLFVSAINGDANFNYEARTDISSWLKLASDIKQMRSASTMEERQRIYTEGNHSSMSLQSLSLTSYELFQEVPIYNVYLSAFRTMGKNANFSGALTLEELGDFDGAPIQQYADTLVLDLFDLGIPRIEGTGSVVFNVLMAHWGHLWLMLQECHANQDAAKALQHLDTAVALWVGEGQIRNDKQKGYFMYSLSQLAGVQFGQDDAESVQNRLVLQVFVALQATLQDNDTCVNSNAGSYISMRWQVRSLIHYANTVLVQLLLDSIQDVVDNGSPSDYVELYSLAINPQIAACDADLYKNIMVLTVLNDLTVDTRDAAIAAVQAAYSCLGITCSDVGAYLDGLIPMCVDHDSKPPAALPALAGYQPTTDVRDISYLDRDILQIDMFLGFGSYLAALDYYLFGWNSEVTLQEIASNDLDWTSSPSFVTVQSYYGADVDVFVQDAIVGGGAFASADGGVRRGVVTGTLQSLIMYLGAMGQSVSALFACSNGNTEEAQARWDSAVALIVGSAEGSDPKGELDGQSLFAISKGFCDAFDTCEPSSSVVDTIILASFQSGAEALVEGECEVASQIYQEKIEVNMLLPLVQGFLFYAVEASNTNNVASQGYLVAYTKGMLPFLDGEEYDSLPLGDTTTGDVNVAAYFSAVQQALPNIGIDCTRVGKISVSGVLTGVCPDDELPPASSLSSGSSPAPSLPPIFVPDPHQDGLAWGRYTFVDESVAEKDSLFTLDVRDMWNASTPQAAEDIYTNPSKYAVDGLAGRSDINCLQKLSTMAYTFMSEDPMYNFFRVALFEDEAFEENSEDQQEWPYADAVEELAVGPENGNSAQLAAETVTVMEIWMAISNRLYDAVRFCKEGDDAPELIDSAVGLWIGQEQGEGKFNSGWSIYAKAQQAIQRFGVSEREAKVNTQLMEQFVVAQTLAKSCSTETTNFLTLRSVVDDILRNLSIPLVQQLLFHMSENNFEYVELYALSFIPQVISVDMGAFEFLRDRLFEGFNWDSSLDSDLFSVMGKSLQAMRFTCGDLGDPSSSGIENLIGLVEALCNELDKTYDTDRLAAYQVSADVMELARIDLDVLQIDLLMRAKAYESALDVYQYGRNARKSDSEFYNLKDLASTDEYSNEGYGKLFTDFYLNASYPDEIITDALVERKKHFAGASRRQLSEGVRRTLQTMVMYNQIHGRLASAMKQCLASVENQESGSASLAGTGQDLVDEAVALYVGSIEGPFTGGNPAAGGQFLYALGKEMCLYFNTCEINDGTYGDAMVNVQLLFAFADTKESLDNGECATAEEIVNDNILPSLQIPLVQGILYYAFSNEGIEAGSSNATLAAGQILTETMLPQIEKSNETSAVIIFENMEFDLEEIAVLDGAEVVFDAMAKALPGMDLDCASIGSLTSNFSVCPPEITFDTPIQDPPPEISPSANTPVILGDNLYETTTYVQDRADIAKDAAEMKEELEKGGSRIDFAQLVYRKGRYSDVYDDEGNLTEEPRSFAKFSKEAVTTMQGNPLYQMTVYALQDEKGLYLGEDASQYADTIVELMFLPSASSKKPLAAEAAVALNLWMQLVNELFETVSTCKNKTLADADGIHSIDEAVAYWVGDGKLSGNDAGHLLYALAEEMAQHFSISTSPHSRTNENILRLFRQAKLEMSLTGACTTNGETVAQIRRLVDKIVSQMMIVNIQALIHFLREDDERDRVRIYAHAVVPLIAGCNPKTFRYLKEKLLDVSYLDVDVEQIIADIRMALPCFGLKCADIGVHTTEPPSACSDPTPTSALADYKPTNDVQAFAEIDLDILELNILMEMEAFEAAEDLYTFGKHVSLGASGDGTALSLKQLATNSGRTSTPQYESFVKYFGDDKYADTIVRQALSNTGDVSMNSIQRRVLVVGASKHMILYMAVLESIYDSIGACSSSEPERKSAASTYWDMASAFLIGSLEGHRMGGSDDGLLLWGLSKQFCDEFGTCSNETPNSSNNNDEMAKYLYSGRSAALNGNCDALKKAANELSPQLLVPMLQASFSTITKLSEKNPGVNKQQVQAEAYILTQSLLPLISAGNHRSATILEENLTLQGVPLQEGVRVVISALAESLSDIGVDCENVGSSETVDSCSGNTKSQDSQILFIVLGSLLGSIAVVGIYLLLRSKRRKNLPENKPLFIKSENAELNHDADLLISRTAGSIPRDSDKGEDDNLIGNDADSTMESDEGDDGDEAYMKAMENVHSDSLQVV